MAQEETKQLLLAILAHLNEKEAKKSLYEMGLMFGKEVVESVMDVVAVSAAQSLPDVSVPEPLPVAHQNSVREAVSPPRVNRGRPPTRLALVPNVPTSNNISADPQTWPHREPKTQELDVKVVEYKVTDETDRLIVRLVIEAGSWEQKKGTISRIRRLTSQQVAGLKAVITRTHAQG